MLTYFVQLSGVTRGWLLIALVGIAVVSYLLGCFNGAVLVSRFVLRDDVRDHGSGNAGLTNFFRVHGGWLSVAVIAIDALKMVLSVVLAWYLTANMSPVLIPLGKYWAGLWCILGHMFPCMFQFRGGKGVMSGGILAIMIDWRVALVVWGSFLILAALTKYISLGSCSTGILFPVMAAIIYQSWPITVLAAISGALLIIKHSGNIVRLIKGEESKFTFKRKQTEKPAEEVQPAADSLAPSDEEEVH